MITIKRNTKKFNEFEFKATFTLAKVLAMAKALELYAPQSIVGNDLYLELKREVEEKELKTMILVRR